MRGHGEIQRHYPIPPPPQIRLDYNEMSSLLKVTNRLPNGLKIAFVTTRVNAGLLVADKKQEVTSYVGMDPIHNLKIWKDLDLCQIHHFARDLAGYGFGPRLPLVIWIKMWRRIYNSCSLYVAK